MALLTEVFDWPDVPLLVVGHLRDSLPEPVYTRIPQERPGAFVRVSRQGGAARGVFDSARLVVECWGDDEATASDLALRVRDALRRMRGSFGGYRVTRTVEAGGPAWSPDELTDHPRFLMTYEITAVAANGGTAS